MKNFTVLTLHPEITDPVSPCTEKAMAPHSSTLAWKIPWMEELGGLQSMGSPRVWYDWVTSLSRIGEGNGNPLQCSCLENPRDGGAWWAAVYGVTQSRTQLKRLSSSSLAVPCILLTNSVTQHVIAKDSGTQYQRRGRVPTAPSKSLAPTIQLTSDTTYLGKCQILQFKS